MNQGPVNSVNLVNPAQEHFASIRVLSRSKDFRVRSSICFGARLARRYYAELDTELIIRGQSCVNILYLFPWTCSQYPAFIINNRFK